MSTTLPPMECLYVTEEFLRELKGGNHSFRLPHPVPILRFLYELSWNLVLLLFILAFQFEFIFT
jgi:THO complex subunit 2